MSIKRVGGSLLGVIAVIAIGVWILRPGSLPPDSGLEEIANGDAQFWLMQNGASHRFIPCMVRYRFDAPLDEALLRERLSELVKPYRMFHRNVVEVDGLPYWQQVEPDWNSNFRVLEPDEDPEALRIETDAELSRAASPGEGLPLFRAYLSADGRELTFMWHHVISDFEGIFNAHARHLFAREDERTRFGYQIDDTTEVQGGSSGSSLRRAFSERPLGFEGSAFEVARHILPVTDVDLGALGHRAGLPMSDVLSFIALRAVTRYHAATDDAEAANMRPLLSPLSLRKDSLTIDEGNRRAVKLFPLVFPLEPIAATYARIRSQPPASTSYDRAGRMLKIARRLRFLEEPVRRLGMPDYISNYFPLADDPLRIGDATLIRHTLRVPMVPYERTKFAWSNYDGEVQLFLHTDPVRVDASRMEAAFESASSEVLAFLSEVEPPDPA